MLLQKVYKMQLHMTTACILSLRQDSQSIKIHTYTDHVLCIALHLLSSSSSSASSSGSIILLIIIMIKIKSWHFAVMLFYFILKYPFYDDLKIPILQLVNLQYPNFTEITDLEQPKVIFQSEDLLKKTASFCLNRMYNKRSQMLTSN